MATSVLLFSLLGFLSISYGGCSCIKPAACAYCAVWDYHHNKDLYQVSCQGSGLTSIPNNLTTFLGNLIASYNRIINITKSSFAAYPYLKSLKLENNHMENVEDGSFLNQAILENLFLDFNNLKQIDAGTFKGLKRLQRLTLRRNLISHLPKEVFSDMQSLTILELGDNRISAIDKEACEGLSNLQSLYLGGNLLKTFGAETLGKIKSLIMLDISFNSIEEIREKSFLELSNLEILHINDCKLKKLPRQEPFKGLHNLKELDLSTNPLFFTSSNMFMNLLKLETLNISSTNISVMHNGTFNSLTSLKSLCMNNNPLLCDCSLKWMSEWLHVNNSNVILEMKSSTNCAFPRKLAGRRLDTLNHSVFLCSCETCKNNVGCLNIKENKSSICQCDSGWIGHSCDVLCNATHKQDKTCSSVKESCYCSYPLLQRRNNTRTCHQRAVLVNVSNILKCQCIGGFTGNGSFCTDINECAQRPQICHPNASCNNYLGSFKCICKSGFEGNGSICYSVPTQPLDVKVKLINTTTVLVMWSVSQTAANNYNKYYYHYNYACILQLKKVGAKYSWTNQFVHLTSPNSTVLSGLASKTMYLLKLILVDARGNRGPASEIVEFMTKEEEGKGDQLQETKKTSNSNLAISVSLAIIGTLIGLALVILISWFIWRKFVSKRPSTILREIPLDVLPELQDNQDSTHSYLNGTTNELQAKDKWEIPKHKLAVGDVIGEGEFGVVREGTLMTEEMSLKVAIKTLKDHSDRSDMKDFLRELDMFKGIGKHPNVVSLIGACTIDGPLYIITEYISGGTLLDLLRDNRCSKTVYINTEVVQALEEHVLVKLALDVAKGMAHIANHRFVHRDLAGRNVLVTENMTAKITDFGLARDIYSDGIYLNSKGGRLPLKWMSPESLQDYVYTTQSDVWSFGILMWEIWTFGAMPYSTVLPHELLSKLMDGYRLEKPADCLNEIYDVMLSCWNLEPMLRPTFCKICFILEEITTNDSKVKEKDQTD